MNYDNGMKNGFKWTLALNLIDEMLYKLSQNVCFVNAIIYNNKPDYFWGY